MNIKTQKKLNYLLETKDLIKAAIEEKGQTVSDTDTFRSYAAKIQAIQAGGTSSDATFNFYGMSTSGLKYTYVESVTTMGDGKTFNSLVVSSIPSSVTAIAAIIDDGYDYTIGCEYDLISGWVYDYRIHSGDKLQVPYTGTLVSYTAPTCLKFVSDSGSYLEFTGSEGNGTLTIKTTAADTSYKIIVG